MGCLAKGSQVGKGSGQGGERRNKHGKMERVENKEADHMQAGCWSVCLSGQALCLITIVCSMFLSNSVCIYCASLLSILGMCARSISKIQVGLASK